MKLLGQGLYAPGQGILPEYDAGAFDMDGMTMIVNRGLGNTGLGVFRVNNRPEVVVLTID